MRRLLAISQTAMVALFCASPNVVIAGGSNAEKAKQIAQQIENSLDMFFVDCHEFPQKLEELVTASSTCKFWGPDPYLKGIPADPWGRQWRYIRRDGNHFELQSLGADGKTGGDGENQDVTVNGTAPKLNKPGS